jgi:hypothetical protein
MAGEMKNFLLFSSDAERNRNRRALVVFLIGMVFVIWAWMNLVVRVMYRASEVPIDSVSVVEEEQTDAPAPSTGDRKEGGRLFARAATPLLAVGFLLVLVFLVGTYVLVRSSRRFLEGTRRERASPTSTPDIWSMHRAPEFQEEDGDEEGEQVDRR